jgi:flagellar basal-body rod modification protein FlgD
MNFETPKARTTTMSTINTAATTATDPTSTSTTTPAQVGGNILGKDAFLKIMMAQLKNQNPLSSQSQDPTQYINELSQLTTLEQTTNLASESAKAAAEQHTVATLAMLGHTVSYTDKSGSTVSGKVDKVTFTSTGPMLTVAGVAGIDPSTVDEVS